MGVPTSEVGYTSAMPRREDHEVHKDMWWHWIKKKIFSVSFENLAVYGIMWRRYGISRPATDDNIIQCMPFAYRIYKARIQK